MAGMRGGGGGWGSLDDDSLFIMYGNQKAIMPGCFSHFLTGNIKTICREKKKMMIIIEYRMNHSLDHGHVLICLNSVFKGGK